MLDNFPTESLKLIKADGKIAEGIIGLVSTSKGKVHIEDTSVDIEEGDTIERTLPNGKHEQFTVLDSGFVRGTGGHIPDHYQVKVEKMTKLPKANSHSSGYITVVNEGGRVNINSTDNSMNIQISNDTERLFDELKKALEGTNDDRLLASVEELKNSVGKPVYAEKYSRFIQGAANHMTLIAPFLPAISVFLVN